jgi:GT2 family glycosyltransferase
MARCSIVVPVFNGLVFLRPMLASLRDFTDKDSYELILSDDGSDAATRSFLKGLHKEAKVLFAPANGGFSKACNAGAQAAEGEFLVFLNSDLELHPGWLEALLMVADEDASVGAVGAKLLYPDGTIQHGGVFLREDRLDRLPVVASHDHVGLRGDHPEANRRADLLAVTAAAMLVRREAFEAVGGFDEEYLNGYEDVDLCLKLRSEGWRVVYEPGCEIVHHESKSGAARFAGRKQNQIRFLERWHGKVVPEVLVTPFLEVVEHPDWNASRPFRETALPQDPGVGNALLLILDDQPEARNVAALAATLESVLASGIGLYDRIVALVGEDDEDAKAYLRLCEGLESSFSWRAVSRQAAPDFATASLSDALTDAGEEFVAVLRPGIVATQGWIARLGMHVGSSKADVAGPLMTGIEGPQDAMRRLPPQAQGSLLPNELSHALARYRPGQFVSVDRLSPQAWMARREKIEAELGRCQDLSALLGSARLNKSAALDVFVHFEPRWVKQPLRAA